MIKNRLSDNIKVNYNYKSTVKKINRDGMINKSTKMRKNQKNISYYYVIYFYFYQKFIFLYSGQKNK